MSEIVREETDELGMAVLRRRFGDNLILKRGLCSLSQSEVAERSGLHVTAIGLIERGRRRPRLDTIVKLAGAIEAESCELLAGMSWRIEPHPGSAGTYVRVD